MNRGNDPPEAPEPQLDLRLGALVVYGGYGVGRISRRQTVTGERAQLLESVVLEFPNGLVVTLPLDRAALCLRSVSGPDELALVRAALSVRDVPVEKSWQQRTRSTRTKIGVGQAVGLAEVVRDTLALGARSAAGKVSMYEHELYLKARRLLAAEIGATTHSDEAQADRWIDRQLDAIEGIPDKHIPA